MPDRLARRLRLFADRDVLHATMVVAAVCMLSLGLVYVGYFAHVLRVARQTPCGPGQGECLLVFGKHAPDGRLDADFEARIERALAVWRTRPPRALLLLGGGPAGGVPEAELARAALLARGLAVDAPLWLEAQSRDTLQNLRNARDMLALELAHVERVTLLSSRYHLARCALLARQLGLEADLCAAEPAWGWRPAALWRVATEAGYVCWMDIGARWARLIGHRRMLQRMR